MMLKRVVILKKLMGLQHNTWSLETFCMGIFLYLVLQKGSAMLESVLLQIYIQLPAVSTSSDSGEME